MNNPGVFFHIKMKHENDFCGCHEFVPTEKKVSYWNVSTHDYQETAQGLS